jgi:hypothetical protein
MLGCLSASAASYTFDINKGISFSWQYDDVIGVYTTKGTRIKHWALDVSDGGKAATFSSYGWSLVEKRKYYLYYPYNDSYFKNDTPITNLPITFDGQMQSGNNSLSHIATYDYMIGEGITDDNSADFKLNHLCSVIRIEYVSPKSAVYTNVALRTTDNVFCRTAEMNLETQSINPTGKDSYASLRLGRIEVNEGETLVAYLVVAPVDLTGWDVKLAIATEDGDEVEFDVQANELRAGKLYLLNTTEIVEKSLSAKRRASSLQEPSVSTYDIPIDTGSEIVVTGIQQTKQNQTQGSETLYTLSGIRTRESSAKGILIKNGKKVIIH